MATYAQIRLWVKDNHGWSVQHDRWIAHCQDLAGLKPLRVRNRADDRRVVPCPTEKRHDIIESIRHFGMLDD